MRSPLIEREKKKNISLCAPRTRPTDRPPPARLCSLFLPAARLISCAEISLSVFLSFFLPFFSYTKTTTSHVDARPQQREKGAKALRFVCLFFVLRMREMRKTAGGERVATGGGQCASTCPHTPFSPKKNSPAPGMRRQPGRLPRRSGGTAWGGRPRSCVLWGNGEMRNERGGGLFGPSVRVVFSIAGAKKKNSRFPLPTQQATYTKNAAAADRPTALSETARAGYRASGTGEVSGTTGCVCFFLGKAFASA
jgi:hypothetical protein